jgi:hypothetical protein
MKTFRQWLNEDAPAGPMTGPQAPQQPVGSQPTQATFQGVPNDMNSVWQNLLSLAQKSQSVDDQRLMTQALQNVMGQMKTAGATNQTTALNTIMQQLGKGI